MLLTSIDSSLGLLGMRCCLRQSSAGIHRTANVLSLFKLGFTDLIYLQIYTPF